MVTINAANNKTAASGKVLQGQGVGTASDFSTATYPATATGTGKVLVADGTNWVASTPTFPNASATSGKIIQSDGTNWVASTPTFPTTAGTSGKVLISDGTNIVSSTPTYPNSATGTGTILRADGTNWVATTSTYPNTNAVSTLLYASSANVMSALATANSGVLTTSSSGVPSIDTTNFAVLSTGVQMKGNNANTAPPAGFIGEHLEATATAVALTSGAAKTVASVTLTAGVWDVSTMISATATGGTALIQGFAGGFSTTNNTQAGTLGLEYAQYVVTGGLLSTVTPPYRVTIAGSTTYYAVATCVYTATSVAANGRISATRVG